MSSEFRGSVWGISGTYKKVEKMPVVLSPCDHYITEKNTLFKHSIIDVHGKEDGTVTSTKIDV